MSLAGLREIAMDELSLACAELKIQGFRLVSITTTDLCAFFEMTYHFDRAMVLRHLRCRLERGKAAKSITTIYALAMITENEIQDQFGIRFEGLVQDYEGQFFLEKESVSVPLCRPVRLGPNPSAKES